MLRGVFYYRTKFIVCLYYHVICVIEAVSLKGVARVSRNIHGDASKNTTDAMPIASPMEFDHTDDQIVGKVGETVSLPCSVKNLGDNVVSWIRRRDLQILSWDTVTFTSDRRFYVAHTENHASNWTLALNDVRASDAGFYECQINTEPVLKRAVLLLVLTDHGLNDYVEQEEAVDEFEYQVANIAGPPERYVHLGSTVAFTCFIKPNDSTKLPFQESYVVSRRRFVKWLHSSNLLTIESSRGGIGIETRILPTSFVSQLTITMVSVDDAGLYTCKPINGLASHVELIVITKDEIEAVVSKNYQRSEANSKSQLFVVHSFYHVVLAAIIVSFSLRRI